MTRAEQLHKEIECTTQEVMEITGLSEDEISRMVFDSAYEWLQHIGCDAYGLEHVPATKEFWSFWRHEWYKVDRNFIRHWLQYGNANTRQLYIHFHNASDSNEYLNSAVIHAAYHRVVKDLATKR